MEIEYIYPPIHCPHSNSHPTPSLLRLSITSPPLLLPELQSINQLEKKKKEMLYIIGLGLADPDDISLKGLKAIWRCSKVYIESYTSLLSFCVPSHNLTEDIFNLEGLYENQIIITHRKMVEDNKADDILLEAQSSDIAFLVVGDPFVATTHTDLLVRAKKLGVEVNVVHNASVLSAVGVCGLQMDRYGQTVSIPFFTGTCRPDSFYDKIKRNRSSGLHTLCLLDITMKERRDLMTINTAIEQLLEVEQNRGESVYTDETMCVGLARVGCANQLIVAGSMKELLKEEFGPPLHCLVIDGDTHPKEEEMFGDL